MRLQEESLRRDEKTTFRRSDWHTGLDHAFKKIHKLVNGQHVKARIDKLGDNEFQLEVYWHRKRDDERRRDLRAEIIFKESFSSAEEALSKAKELESRKNIQRVVDKRYRFPSKFRFEENTKNNMKISESDLRRMIAEEILELNEKVKKKRVVRNGKRKTKYVSTRDGYKIKYVNGRPKEVRMSKKERRRRRKGQRKGSRKRKRKQKKSNRKRKRSNRKRR